VLARHDFVIGEHPWAFADFKTSQSIMRVGGLNFKGVFTRDRRPKKVAHTLREAWAGKRTTIVPTRS
jgi:beta-glucuronidase